MSIRQNILSLLHKEGIKIPEYYDEYQMAFSHVAGTIIKKEEEKGNTCEGGYKVQGFPASAIPLGFLKDIICLLKNKYEMLDRETIVAVLEIFVQRLKSTKIERKIRSELDKESVWYDITFSTKDDRGWYTYNFNI